MDTSHKRRSTSRLPAQSACCNPGPMRRSQSRVANPNRGSRKAEDRTEPEGNATPRQMGADRNETQPGTRGRSDFPKRGERIDARGPPRG